MYFLICGCDRIAKNIHPQFFNVRIERHFRELLSESVLTDEFVQNFKQEKKVSYKATNCFVIKSTRCTKFTNLFYHETLHVSDSSFDHLLEFIHCTLRNGL
jgi:hypothetical protein